jgi:hypothetical protein
MACKHRIAEVALEWWRASGEKTTERLASLVNHWLDVNRITDKTECAAIHADALANRHPWEA